MSQCPTTRIHYISFKNYFFFHFPHSHSTSSVLAFAPVVNITVLITFIQSKFLIWRPDSNAFLYWPDVIPQFSDFCFPFLPFHFCAWITFCHLTLKAWLQLTFASSHFSPALCDLRAVYIEMFFFFFSIPCICSYLLLVSFLMQLFSQFDLGLPHSFFPFDWSTHFTQSLHLWLKRTSSQLCLR